MTAPVVVLVTGSRSLADTPEARWWTVQHLLRALADLPLGSVMVTGDASGPDGWARDLGCDALLPVVVFARGGWADDGRASWPWLTDTSEPRDRAEWRTRLLARDRAMVSWVASREGERRCLALRAPWAKTVGTAFTAARAREAGIAVAEYVCPAEYGPGGVR